MQKEEFKDVIGYEGVYQVSNLGNVKSLSRIILNCGKYPYMSKEKILKQSLDTNKYPIVNLNNKTRKIHQLVAEAFLNHIACGHKTIVDHINNNHLDNRFENLQLITQRQNSSKDVKNKTSKYTGVCWCKHYKKWNANIKINRIKKNLGYFINEEDARDAYQNKLKEIL